MAEEFVPPSLANNGFHAPLVLPPPTGAPFGYSAVNDFLLQTGHTPFHNMNGGGSTRRGNFNHGKRRMNNRTNMAQREDVIRGTVHVSDIDQQVVDYSICGDPNSVIRFAFIDEEGARNAMSLAGTMLGYYPVHKQF
ncbi:hypothetical protein Hanom_Chr01g00023191 [Helianthus anomalus]